MVRHLSLAAALLAGIGTLSVPAHAGEVFDREQRQQARIAQGVGSGQLTAGETARIERREANINQSRVTDLRANGGRLTPGEYRNLNARENSVSHEIYRDKHNFARR